MRMRGWRIGLSLGVKRPGMTRRHCKMQIAKCKLQNESSACPARARRTSSNLQFALCNLHFALPRMRVVCLRSHCELRNEGPQERFGVGDYADRLNTAPVGQFGDRCVVNVDSGDLDPRGEEVSGGD